jgi:1-acyl-sn-glycerol-3-phosphate acyltransferase
MSRKAGTLLWNRRHIEFQLGAVAVDIDTGLTQVNRGFDNLSPNEPGFDAPSRIQVIPMAPIGTWGSIGHGEPTLDPATDTIHVTFFYTGPIPEPPQQVQMPTINVLFWDPHSMVGPGDADTYSPPV